MNVVVEYEHNKYQKVVSEISNLQVKCISTFLSNPNFTIKNSVLETSNEYNSSGIPNKHLIYVSKFYDFLL